MLFIILLFLIVALGFIMFELYRQQRLLKQEREELRRFETDIQKMEKCVCGRMHPAFDRIKLDPEPAKKDKPVPKPPQQPKTQQPQSKDKTKQVKPEAKSVKPPVPQAPIGKQEPSLKSEAENHEGSRLNELISAFKTDIEEASKNYDPDKREMPFDKQDDVTKSIHGNSRGVDEVFKRLKL